jgi:hypothetical protein
VALSIAVARSLGIALIYLRIGRHPKPKARDAAIGFVWRLVAAFRGRGDAQYEAH